MKAKTMKFQEFVNEIEEKLKIYTSPYIYMDKDEEIKEPFIGIQWTTGGTGGGSCWDTGDEDHHYGIDSEPEPEFEDLDKILEHFYPGITHLQYKKLCREVVENGHHFNNEYYGNSTNYEHKLIRLRKLYDQMKAEGWLPE
jgi:hypothetical protein